MQGVELAGDTATGHYLEEIRAVSEIPPAYPQPLGAPVHYVGVLHFELVILLPGGSYSSTPVTVPAGRANRWARGINARTGQYPLVDGALDADTVARDITYRCKSAAQQVLRRTRGMSTLNVGIPVISRIGTAI